MKWNFLILICGTLALAQHSWGQDPMTQPNDEKVPAQSAPASASSDEYEVDYEEEPDAPADEPAPSVGGQGSGKKQGRSSPGSKAEGDIAKNRFQPIQNSEMKSQYKKNGKRLDVDPD